MEQMKLHLEISELAKVLDLAFKLGEDSARVRLLEYVQGGNTIGRRSMKELLATKENFAKSLGPSNRLVNVEAMVFKSVAENIRTNVERAVSETCK